MASTRQLDHEGLQQDYSGLEVAYDSAAPEVDLSKQYDTQEKYALDNHTGIIHSQRICGFPTRTFYILVTVVGIIVIAAAIGGGVGGSRNRDGYRYGIPARITPIQTMIDIKAGLCRPC
jgi:hypothetical protein